jgi:hypothetical protein
MSTRIAILKCLDGTVLRHAFAYSDINRAQDAAVAWVERMMHQHGPGNVLIVNEEYFEGVVPQLRVLNAEDRAFLAGCGIEGW